MARYQVSAIHKISNPNGPTQFGEVTINDNAFSNKKTLGAAMHKVRALGTGESIDTYRVVGNKTIVFPSNRGGRSIWHSITLTHVGEDAASNRSGSINRSPGKKRAKRTATKDGVRVGRVHADQFYSFDDLPKSAQKDHDWAAERPDEQFVRMRYGTKGKGRYEYIPMESFMRVNGTSPSGRKADGFATDSYFSGTAIKLLESRGSDMDYQVWMESW